MVDDDRIGPVSERTLGYIGLGNMGGRITRRLVGSGVTDELRPLSWVFEPFAATVVPMSKPGSVTGEGAEQLPQRGRARGHGRGDGRGQEGRLDLDTILEVLNASSGVNFATVNRFPHIAHGNYLEDGLISALMTKDITCTLTTCASSGSEPERRRAARLVRAGQQPGLRAADQ